MAAKREPEEMRRGERLETGWGKIYVPIGSRTDAPINSGQWCRNILEFCATVKVEGFADKFYPEAAQDEAERNAVALLEAGLNGGEEDVASLLANLSEHGSSEWMQAFSSDALFRRLFAVVPLCPRCGGLRLPTEWDRLCTACRTRGEMFRFTAAVKIKSQIEEVNIPNAAKLKQMACELFGHKGFTAYHQSEPTDAERLTTLARLEEWLDAQFQGHDETRHEAREQWLGMSTGDVIALLRNEIDRPRQDDLLRRAGEQHLHELLDAKTAVEQPHPQELLLRQWLANERVEGKFIAGWHQRIAEAQMWRMPISPVWYVIADCLDELFPSTSNTFNALSSRSHVQEPELFAYLLKQHGLAESESRALTLTKLAQLLREDVQAKKVKQAPNVIDRSGPEAPEADSLTANKQQRSTERGEGRGDERAAGRLLSMFTDGLAGERLGKAVNVLEDDSLTVDQKLWEIDALIPIPPTVAAAKLGEALRVSKTAIQKSTWYAQKRKGQKDNEIGRRHEQHRKRRQQYDSDRTTDDDD